MRGTPEGMREVLPGRSSTLQNNVIAICLDVITVLRSRRDKQLRPLGPGERAQLAELIRLALKARRP